MQAIHRFDFDSNLPKPFSMHQQRTMAATTSSFTRFLDLPEEIQDIILIEHFSSISITIRLSTAGPPAVLTQQWLAIVLSAKALYGQSMPIFYRHALFHVSCPPYRPFYWTDCSETPFLLQVRSVSTSAEGAWSMILGHMPGQCGPVKLKHIVVKDKFDWNKLWDTCKSISRLCVCDANVAHSRATYPSTPPRSGVLQSEWIHL